jgi:hypothetical protein
LPTREPDELVQAADRDLQTGFRVSSSLWRHEYGSDHRHVGYSSNISPASPEQESSVQHLADAAVQADAKDTDLAIASPFEHHRDFQVAGEEIDS